MAFTHVSLKCAKCNKQFIFSAQEHELRASKGYPNEPLLCPLCRQARNARHSRDEYITKKTPGEKFYG